MKILLINPPIREWAKPNCFPMGLGYIAAVLLDAGHEVEVLDLNALRLPREEAEKRLAASDCDVMGVGGIVTTYRTVKWLCETFKKHHPDTPIMAGGSVSTSVPHVILGKTKADIAVISEGEITVVELVKALGEKTPLEAVAGIHFKDAAGNIVVNPKRAAIKNLDDVPLPAWDLFPMDVYLQNVSGGLNDDKWNVGTTAQYKSMNLQGTRGCPYKCVYCYHDFLGENYRMRSPRSIVNEIKALRDKFGVTFIDFNDDCFVINRKFVYEFCDLVLAEGLEVKWGIAGRVNIVDAEMFTRIKEAGCVSVAYGIESGSQKILDLMKKQVKVGQAAAALRLTEEFFGVNTCTVMIGMPGETRETAEETIAFCKNTGLKPEAVFFVTAYPGTELYDYAMKKGLIPDEEKYIMGLWEQGERIAINLTDFTDEELRELKNHVAREVGAANVISHAGVQPFLD